jgi:molybdopterin converting factor small subunit
MDDTLVLTGLAPEPPEEWRRMLKFVGWDTRARAAAARSVEALFARGTELVIETYEYLRSVPETAAVLGWDQGVDPAHLEERRRFFTVWLARTLGLDTSEEFALYLFRAGQLHAGHGPRRIHTPAQYVTGSIGLVEASFARYLAEAGMPGDVLGAALGAWSKYLAAQLNQMMLGYRVARELDQGALAVNCTVFGRLRAVVGTPAAPLRASEGASVSDVLRKFFDYYPQARGEALERVWSGDERDEALWLEVTPRYTPRHGWRVLLNGRDLEYAGGFVTAVHSGDEVALFPPGR